MKSYSKSNYPLLRREFANMQELADVLNKSRSYVNLRMCGVKEFTHRDKLHILAYLGEPETRINELFYIGG